MCSCSFSTYDNLYRCGNSNRSLGHIMTDMPLPTYTRPTREQMLMDIASVVARRSTCNRLSVGAVIALDARVISMGYNGPPSGIDHCQHDNGAPCDDSVHAEANAIVFAARHGLSTNGTCLYVTHMPCLRCAQLIINSGITVVVYHHDYRDVSGVRLMLDAGLEVICR
jgi:dCMP deaminase